MPIKDIITNLFTGTSPSVFFEVGANDGTDTIWLSKLTKTLHVFEPDSRAFAKLSRVPVSNSVILNNCAIGREVGQATFYKSSGTWPFAPLPGTDGDWDKSGSLKKPKVHLQTHPWCKFNESETVPVNTLDNYCFYKNIQKIDFLWADVQGAELDMILGGKIAFTKLVDYFYTEYANSEQYEGQPTLEQIKSALPNYQVIQDFGGDALFKRI